MPQGRTSSWFDQPAPTAPVGPKTASWFDDAPAPNAGMLERLGAMSARDWLGMGLRVGGGVLSGAGFLPGAIISGLGEVTGQLAEGRDGLDWRQIGASAALGAVPLAGLFKAAKPVMAGAGLLPNIVNVASRTGVGAIKGAGVGVSSAAANAALARGELATPQELGFGALLGGGGGALTSAVIRQAAGGRPPRMPGLREAAESARPLGRMRGPTPGPEPLQMPPNLWEGADLPPGPVAPSVRPIGRLEQVAGIDPRRVPGVPGGPLTASWFARGTSPASTIEDWMFANRFPDVTGTQQTIPGSIARGGPTAPGSGPIDPSGGSTPILPRAGGGLRGPISPEAPPEGRFGTYGGRALSEAEFEARQHGLTMQMLDDLIAGRGRFGRGTGGRRPPDEPFGPPPDAPAVPVLAPEPEPPPVFTNAIGDEGLTPGGPGRVVLPEPAGPVSGRGVFADPETPAHQLVEEFMQRASGAEPPPVTGNLDPSGIQGGSTLPPPGGQLGAREIARRTGKLFVPKDLWRLHTELSPQWRAKNPEMLEDLLPWLQRVVSTPNEKAALRGLWNKERQWMRSAYERGGEDVIPFDPTRAAAQGGAADVPGTRLETPDDTLAALVEPVTRPGAPPKYPPLPRLEGEYGTVDFAGRVNDIGDPRIVQELRRMLTELREVTYQRGLSAEEFETGAGFRRLEGEGRSSTTPNLLKHGAGAPVYHEIGGRQTRSQMAESLANFLEGNRPAQAVVKRAYDVAVRRLSGQGGGRAVMPPDAGGPDLIAHYLRLADARKRFMTLDDYDAAVARGEIEPPSGPPPAGGGTDFPFGANDPSGQSGFARPEVLFPLGGAATGALAGPLLFPDDDPLQASIGTGAMGALAGLAYKSPAILERIGYSNLLSKFALPKSMLGNIGALATYPLEHPGSGRAILEGLRDPATADAVRAGWARQWAGQGAGTREASTGPLRHLDLFTRSMSALDEGTRAALSRAGASTEEAGRAVLMGTPRTRTGQKVVDIVSTSPAARIAVPFSRTGVNILESGIERLPGIGMLPAVQKWAQTPGDQLRRIQALGALAMVAGAGTGVATAEGGPLENLRGKLPFAEALAARFALPFSLSARAARAIAEGGAVPEAAEAIAGGIREQAPLPRMNTRGLVQDLLERYMVPYGGAAELISSVEPSQLGGPDAFWRGPLSKIPILNEILAGRAARRTTAGAAPRRTADWFREQ